ncbi:MAG: hypothetical protein A2Y03_01820 [Omnitrophica WOR_2 bacterium GWF2_38_59]|nr:MAG: hypothetical protein A2Y06_05530 [Omnitrophica WOR_2 bacterium GWA2_37_7]OGX22781.1 MAG: hypothetical protein A2Y03_01820 [Omnitrophica WOR_2 bacterium GWF2_38_59]OGX50913.1 MAG: hypothetical protein A2243_06480 [Omnitrophica WOR_2 bacterium RIFOXYA2_FULL_38_17]OGX55308.1 MAG: hypothetical protein A2447_00755 [Omnitrophica WOR_2 bacterium RIFOXYC2_FULL_38_12]OGX60559.1 MAG: hypothetical protein A2306_03105 [Omnitrophica WOR_2 bacterium RIFOXYB2_FULL_38_16]HBG61706.1 hypothetical protei
MKRKFVSILFFCCIFISMVDLCVAKDHLDAQLDKVSVIKHSDGDWELFVGGKPYFIKGVLYAPVKIGEDPGNATMRDWMLYDDDNDGINDVAFQAWVDVNGNGKNDAGEEIGDFQLMKEMGVNTVRFYHLPSVNNAAGDIYKASASTALQYDHAPNKELLRRLYSDYGIRVLVGNFVGSWTIGSGADWAEGTDYTNPIHRENIKKSVKAMVLDHKDEPYVLMWVLGNENNIASWSNCNAKDQPEAYATLIGELTRMIKELDTDHPVVVCEGDNQDMLKFYARHAKEIDVLAYNSYRGAFGFGTLWKSVKEVFDRPVFISEFGKPASGPDGYSEERQMYYVKGNWEDVVANSHGGASEGEAIRSSIGGIVFDWLDRWYMVENPTEQDKKKNFGGIYEEWFGILAMGQNADSLKREKRKVYDYLKSVWVE